MDHPTLLDECERTSKKQSEVPVKLTSPAAPQHKLREATALVDEIRTPEKPAKEPAPAAKQITAPDKPEEMLRAQHMLTTLVDEVRPLEKPEETPKNTSAGQPALLRYRPVSLRPPLTDRRRSGCSTPSYPAKNVDAERSACSAPAPPTSTAELLPGATSRQTSAPSGWLHRAEVLPHAPTP